MQQIKPLGNTSGFFTLGASGTFAKTKRKPMSFHYIPSKDGGFVRKAFINLSEREKAFVTALKSQTPPYTEEERKELLDILWSNKKETNDSTNQ